MLGDVLEVETSNGVSSITNDGVDENGTNIPPGWLRQRAIASLAVDPYLNSGPKFMEGLSAALSLHGAQLSNAKKTLDFGCSGGRLVRALPEFSNAAMFGCDSDGEAVKWCAENLNGEFVHNGEYPPLPWDDNSFDIIYAISVLTHMDQEHQDAWLNEWRRVLKPGGLIFATFKDVGIEAPKMSQMDQVKCAKMIEETGGMYSTHTRFHEGIFENYYQLALHHPDYVRSHWGAIMEVKEIISREGSFISQEAAILQKA